MYMERRKMVLTNLLDNKPVDTVGKLRVGQAGWAPCRQVAFGLLQSPPTSPPPPPQARPWLHGGRKSLPKRLVRKRTTQDLFNGADSSGLLRKDWGCHQPPSKLPIQPGPWLGYKASYTCAVSTQRNPCGQGQEPDTD